MNHKNVKNQEFQRDNNNETIKYRVNLLFRVIWFNCYWFFLKIYFVQIRRKTNEHQKGFFKVPEDHAREFKFVETVFVFDKKIYDSKRSVMELEEFANELVNLVNAVS